MLAPNEFTDLNDPVGFFDEEKPPTTFLTQYGELLYTKD